ncbi:hypothetical protein Ddc_03124 [Ditylenchus destructor]|nr:hypothetical protein Ddc_03124 [Ditylenchus destructor]
MRSPAERHKLIFRFCFHLLPIFLWQNISSVCAEAQLLAQSVTSYEEKDQPNVYQTALLGVSMISFRELVRQRKVGNTVDQCPCVVLAGTGRCITYDARFQAANLEEAMLTFVDNSIDPRIYDQSIGGVPISPATFDCSSEECKYCVGILTVRLRQVGLIQANGAPNFAFPVPGEDVLRRNSVVCSRLRLNMNIPRKSVPNPVDSVSDLINGAAGERFRLENLPKSQFGMDVQQALAYSRASSKPLIVQFLGGSGGGAGSPSSSAPFVNQAGFSGLGNNTQNSQQWTGQTGTTSVPGPLMRQDPPMRKGVGNSGGNFPRNQQNSNRRSQRPPFFLSQPGQNNAATIGPRPYGQFQTQTVESQFRANAVIRAQNIKSLSQQKIENGRGYSRKKLQPSFVPRQVPWRNNVQTQPPVSTSFLPFQRQFSSPQPVSTFPSFAPQQTLSQQSQQSGGTFAQQQPFRPQQQQFWQNQNLPATWNPNAQLNAGANTQSGNNLQSGSNIQSGGNIQSGFGDGLGSSLQGNFNPGLQAAQQIAPNVASSINSQFNPNSPSGSGGPFGSQGSAVGTQNGNGGGNGNPTGGISQQFGNVAQSFGPGAFAGGFSQRKKRQSPSDAIIGNRFVINCVERGDAEGENSEFLNLCTACWTWRQLPEDYFPRLINELVCQENDYCLSGWGTCKQRFRNVDVLRRVGSEWRPTIVQTASCCDCKVKAGSQIHPLVVGKNQG